MLSTYSRILQELDCVGHPEGPMQQPYHSRYKRAQRLQCPLHPMGWDALVCCCRAIRHGYREWPSWLYSGETLPTLNAKSMRLDSLMTGDREVADQTTISGLSGSLPSFTKRTAIWSGSASKLGWRLKTAIAPEVLPGGLLSVEALLSANRCANGCSNPSMQSACLTTWMSWIGQSLSGSATQLDWQIHCSMAFKVKTTRNSPSLQLVLIRFSVRPSQSWLLSMTVDAICRVRASWCSCRLQTPASLRLTWLVPTLPRKNSWTEFSLCYPTLSMVRSEAAHEKRSKTRCA